MKKLFIVLSLLFIPLLAGAAFDSNLYYGLQNNNSVKEMQEFLTGQEVYSGPITGNFYSLTLKAVKDFQKKEKISPVSGFFGPLTRIRANEILSTNVEPSNQQAVQETGSIPPPAEPAKTTNDVVTTLQAQIALLLQQVQAMQAQQTSVQQLQQTVQQQSQVISQIQQNTQQIAQNTTCTPNWNCASWSFCSNSTQTRTCSDSNNCGISTGKPNETQSCQVIYTLEIVSPLPGKGLGREYVASPEVINESNYIELGLIIRNEAGEALKDKIVEITATDSSQNKTLNGTGNVKKIADEFGTRILTPYYPFSYEFRTAGEHAITFSIPTLNIYKSVTLTVNP